MAKCCELLSKKCLQLYRDFFSKAALFMFGLIVSHTMAEISVLTTLFSYLMHNWENQNLAKAATVINIGQGLTTVLAVIVAYIADSCKGLFSMVIICNVSYIVGLALYWYTARFLSPNTDIRIFYATALAVALGRSGRLPVFKAFLADQFPRGGPDIEEKETNRPTNFWWNTASFLAVIIAFALSPFTWATKFLISALFMVANLLLFVSGFASYHREKPTGSGSPLDICFGVIKAAISKRHLNYPDTQSQYYRKNDNDVPSDSEYYEKHPSQILLLPKCLFLRWLDKAAIIEASTNPKEQETLGRLYTVNQVRGVKHILILIPMWISFFAYGMVNATGRTFFIKQSSNMNVLIGKVKVPIITFFVVKSLVSSTMKRKLNGMFKSAEPKKYELVAIGAGMVCSILCCITAWQVEIHRLNLIKKEGIGPSNPDKIISMSVFWLLPQFFLLGLMEGLASNGLRKFISNHVSKSMKNYGPIFSDFVIGFGNFFSIPFVLLCRSWFKGTINTSHLERYFLALAILCSVFLCIYLCVLPIYVGMEDLREDMASGDQELDDVTTVD